MRTVRVGWRIAVEEHHRLSAIVAQCGHCARVILRRCRRRTSLESHMHGTMSRRVLQWTLVLATMACLLAADGSTQLDGTLLRPAFHFLPSVNEQSWINDPNGVTFDHHSGRKRCESYPCPFLACLNVRARTRRVGVLPRGTPATPRSLPSILPHVTSRDLT